MKLSKLLLTLAIVTPGAAALAQPARVQVIHNCADAAADSVDVYLNGTRILDNFAFRTATPYVAVPSGVPLNIGVAPKTSTGVGDTIYNLNTSLTANTRYVAVANGIVSGAGYSPGRSATPFRLSIFTPARAAALNAGNTDVLVVHGATDAPAVDIRSGINTLVDNISFGQFAPSYLQLPVSNYKVRVTTTTGATTVQTYSAPLQTLNLGGRAITVLASGFLTPGNNSNGPAFGLFAADTTGGALVPLPLATPEAYARAQVIHNSADAIADSVDVYLNGTKLLDNFAFRTATPFVDLPSGVALQIGVAPKSSNTAADTVYNLTATLDSAGRYILVANGIVSANGYTPSRNTVPFRLSVLANAREAAASAGQTDVMVIHGSTDAPTVDINSGGTTLVNDISFGQFAGSYLSLPTNDYGLQVRDAGNTSTLVAYSAPLQTLGLQNTALTVLASGFLNPANNSNRAGFGLWAALPQGGPLVPLPQATTGINKLQQSLQLAAHPNPAGSTLTIDTKLSPGAKAKIMDISGRMVVELPITNSAISVHMLQPGIYHVQVIDGASSGVVRFVKE